MFKLRVVDIAIDVDNYTRQSLSALPQFDVVGDTRRCYNAWSRCFQRVFQIRVADIAIDVESDSIRSLL